MTPTSTDLAYLAGLIDGEGCITLSTTSRTSRVLKRKSYNYNPILGIGMTQRDSIDWVNEKFVGGHLTYRKRSKHNRFKGRVWYLSYSGTNAIRILEIIYPYLKLKHPQATIVIAFHYNRKAADGHRRYYGVPEEEYKNRIEYWKLVRSCNAKERWKKSLAEMKD